MQKRNSGNEDSFQTVREGGRTLHSNNQIDMSDEESCVEEDEGNNTNGGNENLNQTVKKLVRYALACEYQRSTIKRTGITEKGK